VTGAGMCRDRAVAGGVVLSQHLRVPVGGKLGFSASEMRRRRAAFGRELDRSGTSYALVYGANRSGSAVSWLTGWPVTREALVVVAPEGAPARLPERPPPGRLTRRCRPPGSALSVSSACIEDGAGWLCDKLATAAPKWAARGQRRAL